MTRPVVRFTIQPILPTPLAPLARIARNLAWTWERELADVLRAVDPERFDATGNPVEVLAYATDARLHQLAGDAGYVEQVARAAARLDTLLNEASWYATLGGDAPRSIAYFSPEFGIGESLPLYSGGLGVLAGDHLKSASDLGVPIVGVGLFYRQGYFRQVLTAAGAQREEFRELDLSLLPVAQVTNADGTPVHVSIPLPGGVLHARVLRVEVGRVPLLLLDTDVPANAPAERAVTDRLYGGDSEHRLRQEILLGIGGMKALAACRIEPGVFHMNEGHAGFSGLERIRVLVEEHGVDAAVALEAVRSATVFTTHTPVPAGIDRFPRELVARYFGPGGIPTGLPVERLLELGAEQDPAMFNMAVMGIRLAARVNGVSRLHGAVSRTMFSSLWPGLPAEDAPIGHITNGVHAETWIGPEFDGIYRSRLGDGYGAQGHGWATLDVSDEELYEARRAARGRLVEEIRRRLRAQSSERGMRGDQLGFIDGVFDPEALTIGFARRVPTYKRLTLMLLERERLTRLLTDPERPLQIVIAGKAHPHDSEGKALIEELGAFANGLDVRHRIVMLPDYDMALGRALTSGVDVWLNNPLRPFEACGTSGMKAALNGGLNLSVLDGWWDELYDGQNGWAIPSADDGTLDAARRDAFEAHAILDLLEGEIVPRFYDRDHGMPRAWLAMSRHTITRLGPQILATRMLRDYVQQLYVPVANGAQRLAADGYAAASRLAAWKSTVAGAWKDVSVTSLSASPNGGAPGRQLPVQAIVKLGSLTPDDVIVQALYGAPNAQGELEAPALGELTASEQRDGGWLFSGQIVLPAGPLGLAIRVLPHTAELHDPRELGLVATS